MTRSLPTFAALPVLCVLAAPAAAESVPFLCPVPGTVIETSTGGRLAFAVGSGLECAYTLSERSKRRRFAHVTGTDGTIYKQAADKLAALWPLTPGREVSLVTYRGKNSWTHTYRVSGPETVDTAAGNFVAFRIEHSHSGNQESYRSSEVGVRYAAIDTIWYAPEVGYTVKFQHLHISGTPSDSRNWEVVRVARP
ncbi:MAG TPA: hypothetical protein VD978_12610 [Azospirillum sp.]|nr:hypothetical protein [Azospirillum sp.]